MSETNFPAADAWRAWVEKVCDSPTAASMMTSLAVERELVVAVAMAEASAADPSGVSTLTHAELASRVGASSRKIAKARLILVETGLETLEIHPLRRNGPYRKLHPPRHEPFVSESP